MFLDDDTPGCADASFCASYCWFLLGGAVLSQSPFFYRIVLYVHPHGHRIDVVAVVLGVASELQGIPLGVLRCLKLVMAGW